MLEARGCASQEEWQLEVHVEGQQPQIKKDEPCVDTATLLCVGSRHAANSPLLSLPNCWTRLRLPLDWRRGLKCVEVCVCVMGSFYLHRLLQHSKDVCILHIQSNVRP